MNVRGALNDEGVVCRKFLEAIHGNFWGVGQLAGLFLLCGRERLREGDIGIGIARQGMVDRHASTDVRPKAVNLTYHHFRFWRGILGLEGKDQKRGYTLSRDDVWGSSFLISCILFIFFPGSWGFWSHYSMHVKGPRDEDEEKKIFITTRWESVAL